MTGMAPAAQYGLPPEPRGLGGVRRLSCAGAVAGRRGPWTVGPRPGFRGTGAEFEVVLVVAGAEDPGQSACRPDDDPPRVRRWTEEKVAA